ncbi:conserved exported hypothetical protein [uncultured Paludibacter sp.]|nr:conserved exported hypothetical protein [uncultured Paludibacter sp.]
MKKYFLSIIVFASTMFVSAQTEYDALKLTQTDINGTARYMSMGGAFGALGGDASALKDNPAGLGVYRSSEFAVTIDGTLQNSSTTLQSVKTNESDLNLRFNHLSYVVAIPLNKDNSEGLVGSNFSFTYNKVRDFNRKLSVNGPQVDRSFTDFLANFTNAANRIEEDFYKNPSNNPNYDPYLDRNSDGNYAPWLSVAGYWGYLIDPTINSDNTTTWSSGFGGQVTPYNYLYERGSINEYGFGWGGNFSNRFFLGANLNITSLDYNLESTLSESFSGGGDFSLKSYLSQTGTGVNFKLGVIYLLTNNLRVGASIHTPTFYSISESNDFQLYSSKMDASYEPEIPSQIGNQTYKINGAFQAQGSLAYLFGKKGLISAEYNFINYPSMRFKETNGNTEYFKLENDGMSQVLRNGNILKLGGEYKINQKVALRAGYAYTTGATNPDYTDGKALEFYTTNTNTEYFDHLNSQYFSIGAGYREASWFLDAAYALRVRNENFYSYQGSYGATSTSSTNNLVVTLGFKF